MNITISWKNIVYIETYKTCNLIIIFYNTLRISIHCIHVLVSFSYSVKESKFICCTKEFKNFMQLFTYVPFTWLQSNAFSIFYYTFKINTECVNIKLWKKHNVKSRIREKFVCIPLVELSTQVQTRPANHQLSSVASSPG